MKRVIIVDDHELFRLGVKGAIENKHPDISIVGEADSGVAFFRLLDKVAADIVLLDIFLPDTSGIEIARRLKKERPGMRILAISSENSAEVVKTLINIGIDGFISKRMGSSGELANAIRSIMDGIEYFGKDISSIIYNIFVAKKGTSEVSSEFTEREREIITLCHRGLQGKEIAAQLGLSPKTIANYKDNIFRKLGINSTYEMVQYALKTGVISMDS